MLRQSTTATQQWDDEHIAQRIRLRLAEERGASSHDQRELRRRISEPDNKIAAARGSRSSVRIRRSQIPRV